MARYRVDFYDFGRNVRAKHEIEHDTDEKAIEAALRRNVLPHISAGFEVWQGERLVHQHTNHPALGGVEVKQQRRRW